MTNLEEDSELIKANTFLKKRQFLQAAKVASDVASIAKATEANKKEALRIQLYSYNRMQWLVDGSRVVSQLQNSSNLVSGALLEVALFNVLLGATQRARFYFMQALKQSPKDALLYSECAITYEQDGDADKALDMYEKIIVRTIKGRCLSDVAVRVFARVSNLRILTNAELDYLQREYYKHKSDLLGTRLAFLLARAKRKLGDIESEIKWLKIANIMSSNDDVKSGLVWSITKEQRRTALITQVFDQATPSWMPNFSPCDTPYIFILGMPRSGTTLLEQILGAHLQVNNSGESRAFEVALSKVNRSIGFLAESSEFPFIENIQNFSQQLFVSIISNYRQYQNMFGLSGRLTDKALTNINWVGLLANLFPAAHFVYIERNSLDNCTSLLQHDFNNAPYASNPEHCILEHDQYHQRAMHWKELYSDRFFCLNYEALTLEPQLQLSQLINFLGLNWEDEILNFHLRKNSVRTPSLGQVRKSINASQVDKWENYRDLLEPAITMLGKLNQKI